jgi:hypothetical protein
MKNWGGSCGNETPLGRHGEESAAPGCAAPGLVWELRRGGFERGDSPGLSARWVCEQSWQRVSRALLDWMAARILLRESYKDWFGFQLNSPRLQDGALDFIF